jgi:hypothetical protein
MTLRKLREAVYPVVLPLVFMVPLALGGCPLLTYGPPPGSSDHGHGLRRQRKVSRFGEDEAHYLAPLDHYLFEEGRCPAARLLELWQGPWAGEVRRLIEHSRY